MRPAHLKNCTSPTHVQCIKKFGTVVSANGAGNLTLWAGVHDDETLVVDLPFNFSWGNNYSYNFVSISSNGFVGFARNMTAGCCFPPDSFSWPNSYYPPLIAAYWADSIANNSIYYGMGSGPYKTAFVIRYDPVTICCDNQAPSVFEIVLFPDGTALTNCISCTASAWSHFMGFQTAHGEGQQAWPPDFRGAWKISRNCNTTVYASRWPSGQYTYCSLGAAESKLVKFLLCINEK